MRLGGVVVVGAVVGVGRTSNEEGAEAEEEDDDARRGGRGG